MNDTTSFLVMDKMDRMTAKGWSFSDIQHEASSFLYLYAQSPLHGTFRLYFAGPGDQLDPWVQLYRLDFDYKMLVARTHLQDPTVWSECPELAKNYRSRLLG